MKQYNRTTVIVSFLALAGWLAFIDYDNMAVILAAVSGPVSAYIGIKGKNGNE